MRKNKTVKFIMIVGLIALLLLHGSFKGKLSKEENTKNDISVFSFEPEFYKLMFLGYDGISSRFLIFSLQNEKWSFYKSKQFENMAKKLELISEVDKYTYYPYFLGTLFAFISRSPENADYFIHLLEKGINRFKENSWLPFRTAMLFKHIYYDNKKALFFANIAKNRELKYAKHPSPFIIAYPVTVNGNLNTKEDFQLYVSSVIKEVEQRNPEAKKDVIKKLKQLLNLNNN